MSQTPTPPPTAIDELRADVAWIGRMCRQLTLSPSLAAELADRAARVQQKLDDPSLHIVVVGEFNSGKSTFINTLLRDRLLPTAPVITTGCAVDIRHGEDLTVSFRPRSGLPVIHPHQGGGTAVDAFWKELRRISRSVRRPQSGRDAIRILIADPDVCVGVEAVSIEHPAQFLGRDVVIVDTPGINATDELHAAVVDKVVAEIADLAVVLVPASSPVSRVLTDFLTGTLRRHLDRCIFVVTKLDQVEPDHRDALIRAVHRRLDLAGVIAPRVFTSGSDEVLNQLVQGGELDTMAHQFQELERALADLAEREHTRAVNTSATHLVTDLLEAAAGSVAEHRTAIVLAERELSCLQIPDLDTFLGAARSRLANALARKRRSLRRQLERKTAGYGAELTAELEQMLDACTTTNQVKELVTTSARQLVATRTEAWMTAELARLSTRLSAVADTELSRVRSDFTADYQRLARLAGQASTALAVPPAPVPEPAVDISVDFGAAVTTITESISVENWSVGGGGALGAFLGTLLMPGIGTAIGGFLGAALGAGAGDQIDKARSQVREPLAAGTWSAVNNAGDVLVAALDDACSAEERRCEQGLQSLREVTATPIARLLGEEHKRRDELRRARQLAMDVEREAERRLERLGARRQDLAALREIAS